MIISLDEAKKIDPTVTKDELDAYEQMVRQLTNNHFQNLHARYHQLVFTDQSLEFKSNPPSGEPIAIREGDTIQISDSKYNDGLHVVKSIDGKTLTLDNEEPFFEGSFFSAFITKIKYPADIRIGVRGLIEYKAKMGSKLGIKSETIARMSVTYYDVNATDNIEGFPASKFSFLKKYKKMRWG
ncbi:hypothetical protein [Enterococcus avium]|uniref:hypothetical protein n=1 Tax=Enterococcus avium TaxID=33945 RepID=UPI00288D515F|nr:hypothetical protein [Enterococcus avium]MDT2485050.1 hypothetical protein [Enterococcus avium]MDT2511636.1 hypothetical protein [Enterococcus avium]